MTPEDVIFLSKNAVLLIFYLSMPIIVAATAVGLIVALVQTLIQLQEQTLSFAAKLIVIVLMLSFMGPWMANQLLLFMGSIFERIG